jgi:hypothetical protein
MMKAPDKIYITSSEGVYYESDGSCSITEIWEVGEYDISEGIEYIRKDLHDAEIERLREYVKVSWEGKMKTVKELYVDFFDHELNSYMDGAFDFGLYVAKQKDAEIERLKEQVYEAKRQLSYGNIGNADEILGYNQERRKDESTK